ncbi:MAG: substrate-binding domain-containing protein [Anaerolineae bacterium]|nr:substrate-binding domain-containing protein [Anaerolineae bacterium]
MKKLVIVSILMTLILSSFGLVAAQHDIQIGLSVPTYEQDFYVLLVDNARTAAEEAGVTLVVPETDALLDIDAELANVQMLIESGIDVLLLYPVDDVLSLGAVEAAAEANVPVVLLEADVLRAASDIEDLGIVGVVTTDAEIVGADVAEYLCTELDGEGTVITLMGVGLTGEEEVALESQPAYQLMTAYASSIETYFTESCSGITLLVEGTDTYTNADSLTNFSTLIADNTPDAIITGDAVLTIDVVNAARRARLRGLIVIGLERSDDVLGALEAGQVTLVIIPDPVELGSSGMNVAVAVLDDAVSDTMMTVNAVRVDAELAEQYRPSCDDDEC